MILPPRPQFNTTITDLAAGAFSTRVTRRERSLSTEPLLRILRGASTSASHIARLDRLQLPGGICIDNNAWTLCTC